MQLALILPPTPDDRWQLAKQLGVTNAVVHPLEIGDGRQFWSYDELLGMANWFGDSGIEISVMEGSVPLTDATRLGLDGRAAEIAAFEQFLRDCGELGIPTVCYDWMPGIRWARTEVHLESRGGSLVTGFNSEKMQGGPRHEAADVTPAELWENLEHFLMQVVPVAEEAGVKLGLHPDDPPRKSVRGVSRIITSIDSYDRVLDIVDSEYNGITFCQGNFAAMGVDIPTTIRYFGERINFVHFRDVIGNRDRFVETWHDDGPTDMLSAMEAYADIGYDGVMRPDHVPTLVGEDNSSPGYHTKGRIFAIGYMKGLIESVEKANK